MPLDPDTGALRPFTEDEIEAFEVETAGVRDASHGEETRELGQNTMRKSFWVKWERRFDFCACATGDEVLYDDSGTTKLSRLLPHSVYGRHPEFPELICTKVDSIRGAGGPGTDERDEDDEATHVVEYPKALVTLFYESVMYDIRSDQSLVDDSLTEQDRYTYFQDSDGDIESYVMPGGIMRYLVPDGTTVGSPEPHLRPLQANVSWNRPVETFTMVWERLPYELFAAGSGVLFQKVYGTGSGLDEDAPWLGTINRQVLFGRLQGTCLLTKVKPTLLRSHTAEGRRWRIAFTWAYCPFGWTYLRYFPPAGGSGKGNYFVSVGTTIYDADSLPDNESLYSARDHNDLWHVNL